MISVVMPVFNQARFIMRAVESVWAQNFADIEIIIVDDGSTDDTPALLRTLSEKGVRCIRQENAGPAVARNRAIRESRGEWIAFLDGDDYWLPGKLEKQLRVLKELGGDFAYCGAIVVDDEERVVEMRHASCPEPLLDRLIWGNLLATPTVIVRRSLLDQSGLFDEALRMGEDWDLWLRLATHGKGCCVSEPLVAVRFSDPDAKYKLDLYDVAIPRIFSRLFESLNGREEFAGIARQRGRILSVHFSMLAKAHFQRGKMSSFLRYSARSIVSSPQGFLYLLPVSLKARPS